MPATRRIAILNPSKGLSEFIYPIEEGDRDCHSHASHAAKYGGGGFTGERCMKHRAGPYAGKPVWFRLGDHEGRLEETIRIVKYLQVCPRAQRIEARFRLAALNPQDCYFSLVFGSEGRVGVYPKHKQALVVIVSEDMDPFEKPYFPPEIVKNGMNVMVITDPDIYRGPLTRFSRAKVSINYLRSNVVKCLAEEGGYDDGLMLDECGYVSELSVSNLIVLEKDGLVTPHAASSALNGITKRSIGTIAHEVHGLPLREQAITVEHLSDARAIFATGTAVGVVKINRIFTETGRQIYQAKDEAAKQLVEDLGAFYWRLLYGEESGFHPEWFTPVPADILAMPEPLVHEPSYP